MSEKAKTYRINKVATEFNVSWKTIVEHLQSKGFEVEAKITAKIDQEMYNDLLSFYQKDKIAKEESQQLEINIRKDAKTQGIKELKKDSPSGSKEKENGVILIKDTSISSKSEESKAPEVKEEPKEIEEKPVEAKSEDKQAEEEDEKKE